MPLPTRFPHLVTLLSQQARQRPGASAFRFADREVAWGELWSAAEGFAARLLSRGLCFGDRVILALPNGPEFFQAFYGTQRAGGIPVPLFPESGIDRILDIAGLCGATKAVLDQRVLDSGDGPSAAAAGARCRARGLEIVSLDEDPPRRLPTFPELGPDHPALIQYTSGSTGDPKGVVIRHDHLLTNMQQMIDGMEITADDVFVSWLPVHHDMGLILMTLVPMALGARLILLPTRLTDVRHWLEAIARHRGTFTAAPDFAYRLCLRAVRDPAKFDLHSLRVALNASEPVRHETIRRFEAAFGLQRVMRPGYGLAEATVGVSMQPPGTPIAVSERGFVSLGRPFAGIRFHVVTNGDPAAEGEVGEIVVESPANTTGYFDNPRATAELFWRPGCIRTGDLGFHRDGEVYLVGRKKNIIIQAGRNLSPPEIQEAVEALAFVRRVAAVGIDRGRAEGEQAYVFVELRKASLPPPEKLLEMATEVVVRFHQRLGLRPGRVILLKPRSIPLTANGKLRPGALRQAYLDGSLEKAGHILFPEP